MVTRSESSDRFFITLLIAINLFFIYGWWTLVSYDRLDAEPMGLSLRLWIGLAVVLHTLPILGGMVDAYAAYDPALAPSDGVVRRLRRLILASLLLAVTFSVLSLTALLRVGTLEAEMISPMTDGDQCEIPPPEARAEPGVRTLRLG
jgi:hypothetical protein